MPQNAVTWPKGSLRIIGLCALLCTVTAKYAEDDVLVRRRVLLPDFITQSGSPDKTKFLTEVPVKLRSKIDNTDRFTVIDQKLLGRLRPGMKSPAGNLEEWGKLGEELNCENIVIGIVQQENKTIRLNLQVIDSVTRNVAVSRQLEVPPGPNGQRVLDEALSQVVREMAEKLEPLDAGEVWREVALETQLAKIDDEYYRPIRLRRLEKQKQEKLQAEKLMKKRFEEERRRQMAKLEQQRKQRLREIEEEKKRVAEARAKNPEYDKATAANGELARVAIFDFTDQTGSSDYQYLSGSLSGGVDMAMKARFNYILIEPEKLTKVKTENFKDGWLSDADGENIAKQAGADILISGTYSIPKGQNQLLIRTVIFINPTGETLALPDFTNAIDGTLFEATELLSAQIVQKIMELARSQMGAKAGDPKAKVTLTRAITTGWPTKSWEIAALSGIEGLSGGGQLSSSLGFVGLRFFPGEKAAFRFGIYGGVSILPGPATSPTAGGYPPAAGVEIGYQLFLSPRWKIFGDLVPRYDFSSPRSAGGFVPGVRVGGAFLLLSHMAIELYADAAYYSSVSKAGFGTGIGVTFPF